MVVRSADTREQRGALAAVNSNVAGRESNRMTHPLGEIRGDPGLSGPEVPVPGLSPVGARTVGSEIFRSNVSGRPCFTPRPAGSPDGSGTWARREILEPADMLGRAHGGNNTNMRSLQLDS